MRKYVTAATALLFFAALPVLANKPVPTPGPAPDPPSLCDSIAGNLVMNCGFETGDFTDWTRSGNLGFTGVTNGSVEGLSAHSGSYFAFLGPIGSDGFISQTLATTAGATYQLQWFLGSDGGTPNDFDAEINGVPLFSQTNIPSTGATYTLYAESFVGTGSDALTFSFRNDPGYLALDDISVTPALAAVPEPTSVVLLLSLIALAGVALRRRISHRLVN